jgi:crotonobetainyl-CoA:carnitine CoA-transferase CaiB-like acyl-CoA transferase
MVQIIDQSDLGRVKVQGNPIKMSATDPRPRGPAPFLGEDTEQVLEDLLGVSLEDCIKFKEDGVI